MEKFKVVQCPKCCGLQVTSSDTTLSCKLCNRSTSLERVKSTGCYYGSHDNPLAASEMCRTVKMNFKGLFKLKIKKFIRKAKNVKED